MHHFFPYLRDWMDAIRDPRDPDLIDYPLRSLLWSVLLMFMFDLQARRRLAFEFNTPAALANLNLAAQTCLETLPHPDTVAYLLERLSPEKLNGLRCRMAHRLLRSRVLEKFRLFEDCYLIAFDGTGFLAFSRPPCSHCLTMTLANGRTIWYHPVLEAKLVCPNGLAISMGTEFIENADGLSKQDCELKAFYRLLPRLRQQFPRLPICLLLDGLYLNQTVLDLAQTHSCRFLITFKEGSLPEAYDEFVRLWQVEPHEHFTRTEDQLHREFRWLESLQHQRHKFNALECVQTDPDGKSTRFFWATDYPLNANNVEPLSEGGRDRWTIENEGFNTQKHGGYALEHPYSEDWKAEQNFYLLLQIAHLLNQLIVKGSLLAAPVQKLFGSIRGFFQNLREAWRTCSLDPSEIQLHLSTPFQIRLDSS